MAKKKILLISALILSALLRLYNLGSNPPSLYWDEASLGYNAYAISRAGIDEHGESWPVARFIAFGDNKPPGYIYASVLAVKLFGLSEFSIRLPSALAGVGLVVVSYYLSLLLFRSSVAALLGSLVIAFSPWSIQLSRGAFEANLAAFFNAAGVYSFLLGARRKYIFLPLSVVFFVASFYTFNANRIIAPILFLSLSILLLRHPPRKSHGLSPVTPSQECRRTPGRNGSAYYFRSATTVFLLSLLIGILFIVPSISYLRSPESRLRFQEVSIFTDLSVIKKANKRIEREGNAWWAKIIHNRRVLFAREYLKHFVDHFNPRYLFISGDANPRLSVQAVGELYLYELPFLVVGFFTLFKKKKFIFLLLILWVIVAIIPAATARETPHALRTASVIPTYQMIIGYGGYMLWRWLRKKVNTQWFPTQHRPRLPARQARSPSISSGYLGGVAHADKTQPEVNTKQLLRHNGSGKENPPNTLRTNRWKYYGGLFIVLSIIVGSWFYYLHYYFIHYPKDWAGEWQDGYKEMVAEVTALAPFYDKVVVSGYRGRPYIYFLLYQKVSPRKYLNLRRGGLDAQGFWHVEGFGKYYFGSKFKDELAGKILFVGGPGEVSGESRVLGRIYSRDGKVAFVIAEI